MVVQINLTSQVSVNHLSYGCCPVCFMYINNSRVSVCLYSSLSELDRSISLYLSLPLFPTEPSNDESVCVCVKLDLPGNLINLTFFPSSTKRCSNNLTCVVFPLRSNPSSTINEPRGVPGPAGGT